MEDRADAAVSRTGRLPETEARLLEQIRSGEADAGCRFVREQYPGIYQYLLYLTGQPDLAADLTQETFLQAWRHLDSFQGRASLRSWLHQIARREFLQSLRGQPAPVALEATGDLAAPDASAWTDAVELREVIDRLPLEQREVVLLHYLEGYTSTEIAQIVEAPVGTVCYRLSRAREKLRQALGEDDLTYLNEPQIPGTRAAGGCQWPWLPLDQMHALETRLTMEETMERREFLRHAAAGAAGLMLPETGKEVVDSRLTEKVTLTLKATALSDLCEHLKAQTGVQVTAGPSVADEKVTLLCKKMPLREVMRQLSRPFGYAWLRSGLPSPHGTGEPGCPPRRGRAIGRGADSGRVPTQWVDRAPGAGGRGYRYELAQDLRSQLLEEELRNRDRHAALVELDRDIEGYRPYQELSPDEALAKARTAPPAEKKLLEKLAGFGWGPVQMYFRLSPQELAALRAGETLTFNEEPGPGERPLPAEVARGVLQSFREWRVVRRDDGHFVFGPTQLVGSEGVPATQSPHARARVRLRLEQSELGSLTLEGGSTCFGAPPHNQFWHSSIGDPPYATGQSPDATRPANARTNRRLTADQSLAMTVSVRPESSCRSRPQGSAEEDKVSTADVLEALHRATGRPIIADYYTRLYPAPEVTVQNLRLFDALNQLSDEMRLRWNKDGEWVQFRSASFYDDRVKEVPNRLLSRWSASRRRHGALTLDDLVEIAQLSDAQLDGAAMAEGARHCWGLTEWELAANAGAREHLRFLAGFTPEQRQAAMSSAGLAFTRMSLAQQQGFLSLATPSDAEPLQSLTDLDGAALRVDYSLPGWFQWGDPGMFHSWLSWVVPVVPGPQGRRVLRPMIRERSREAVLQAMRRLDPEVRTAALQSVRDTISAAGEAGSGAPLEAQVYPTTLRLTFVYVPGLSNARRVRISSGGMTNYKLSW